MADKTPPISLEKPKNLGAPAMPAAPIKGDQGEPSKRNWFMVVFWWLFGLGVLGAICLVAFVALLLYYFSRQVPDIAELQEWQPKQITKVYSHNGDIMSEFATERRVYTPYEEIPRALIDAFLAAEDSGFYEHGGYDLKAIARAAYVNLTTGRTQGGSTITQQVAKNMLLTSERKYSRKIKEIILSRRMEQALPKEKILELYLNQIYLGHGAYGVTAAARTYFNKDLAALTVAERAFIAGLPKAPSRYSPIRHPERAKARRDTIIRRMETENIIDTATADAAILADIETDMQTIRLAETGGWFSEHVRRQLLDTYDEGQIFEYGLKVFTTVDVGLQTAAEAAVKQGVVDYDRRHGYRGVLWHFAGLNNDATGWQDTLIEFLESGALDVANQETYGQHGVVTKLTKEMATVGLVSGQEVTLSVKNNRWASPFKLQENPNMGHNQPKLQDWSEILKQGDLILVQTRKGKNTLAQVPKVQAALISLDAQSGAVRAMVGGMGDTEGFNRAIQGKRQVGSAFKPFVYLAALKKGYTAATEILDAPVVFRKGSKVWKPRNYSYSQSGYMPMRVGLEKSKNLMTIRLAREIGMAPVLRLAAQIGLNVANLPTTDLTIALGTASYSPLEIALSYAPFANGGKRVEAHMIDRIHDASGKIIQRHLPACQTCQGRSYTTSQPPILNLEQEQVVDPKYAFLMNYMLQGVVERGTAKKANDLPQVFAGKTGTTNEYKDAWFVGFTPRLVTAVWLGFDTPETLGNAEGGGNAALPIFKSYMEKVLAETGSHGTFQVPAGLTFARIDAKTGLRPSQATKNTIIEAFVAGTEPTKHTREGFFDTDAVW